MNLKEFAVDNSREEFSPSRRCDHKFVDSTACLKCGWTPPPTHWIDSDSPYVTRTRQRAACGALVDSDTFSTAPTCELCQARLAELEAMTF